MICYMGAWICYIVCYMWDLICGMVCYMGAWMCYVIMLHGGLDVIQANATWGLGYAT